jgi:hypothetical protein
MQFLFICPFCGGQHNKCSRRKALGYEVEFQGIIALLGLCQYAQKKIVNVNIKRKPKQLSMTLRKPENVKGKKDSLWLSEHFRYMRFI